MGFIGSLFGGNNGANFQATGSTVDQANQLFGQQQGAHQQQQDFINALMGRNQSNPFANQLNALAAGTGPNPAMNQLAQTTGQNIASQAALQAGQRGVGANPGLLARNIAQQGGQLQQQAGGQAATMGAQQQLGAIGQMGQLQGGALQGLNQSALQGQQNVLGSISGQNAANAGVQSHVAGAQIGALGGALGAVGSVPGLFLNQGGQVPQATPESWMGANTKDIPAQQMTQPIPDSQNQMPCFACGGMVKGYADGGMMMPMPQQQGSQPSMPNGPQSPVGQFMQGFNNKPKADFQKIAQAGKTVAGSFGKYFESGGEVTGKAKVMGDSPANDTVPAMLSPGEVVIPRSKTRDPAKTAEFINAILGMSLKAGKKA